MTKTCFVASPIGPNASEIRRRSDRILNIIIKPIAEECGYTVIRADQINDSGSITAKMLDCLLDSDLVIADLTDHNPNVFCEIAVRHGVGKHCIQMIAAGQNIPFDLYDYRTIEIEGFEYEQIESSKSLLRQYILSAELQPIADNPLSRAIKLKKLVSSDSPIESTIAQLSSTIELFSGEISTLKLNFDVLAASNESLTRSIQKELNAESRPSQASGQIR